MKNWVTLELGLGSGLGKKKASKKIRMTYHMTYNHMTREWILPPVKIRNFLYLFTFIGYTIIKSIKSNQIFEIFDKSNQIK